MQTGEETSSWTPIFEMRCDHSIKTDKKNWCKDSKMLDISSNSL